MSVFTAMVLGVPVPQGSLRTLGRGRVVHNNDEKLRPWRDSIAWAVRERMDTSPPLEGPVEVTATFVLPRPQSAPKRRWAPDRKPDLDKLIRALLDGITAGGGWVDDAQVISMIAVKVYATETVTPRVIFSVGHAVQREAVAS